MGAWESPRDICVRDEPRWLRRRPDQSGGPGVSRADQFRERRLIRLIVAVRVGRAESDMNVDSKVKHVSTEDWNHQRDIREFGVCQIKFDVYITKLSVRTADSARNRIFPCYFIPP